MGDGWVGRVGRRLLLAHMNFPTWRVWCAQPDPRILWMVLKLYGQSWSGRNLLEISQHFKNLKRKQMLLGCACEYYITGIWINWAVPLWITYFEFEFWLFSRLMLKYLFFIHVDILYIHIFKRCLNFLHCWNISLNSSAGNLPVKENIAVNEVCPKGEVFLDLLTYPLSFFYPIVW